MKNVKDKLCIQQTGCIYGRLFHAWNQIPRSVFVGMWIRVFRYLSACVYNFIFVCLSTYIYITITNNFIIFGVLFRHYVISWTGVTIKQLLTMFIIYSQPDQIRHGYVSRQTALDLCDPWVDLQMDIELLPKIESKIPKSGTNKK